MDTHLDIAVVGGGAAGLTCAIELRRRGLRPTIVTDGPVGGDCTFTGCIPSKTLLAAARSGLGFAAARRRVIATVDRVAATEAPPRLAEHGIAVLTGRAELVRPGRMIVDGCGVTYDRLVLALGSEPAVPGIAGLGAVRYLTSDTVWDLTDAPATLAVLGGGPIGCELGQAFARFGTRVTIVESERHLLPHDDAAAAALVADRCRRDGIAVHTGATVVRASSRGPEVDLALDDGTAVAADVVLVATGRSAPTAFSGLEAIGVDRTDDGWIATDGRMRTTADDVWAIGDCTGSLQFTHAAAEMARVAAADIAPEPLDRLLRPTWDPALVPRVTFTEPEVAQVGVTESEAAGRRGARVAVLPMGAVDRARTDGDESGFVKLVTLPRGPRGLLGNAGGGRLAGATIVGGPAGETIAEPTLVLRRRMFAGRLAESTHAYPTWSTAVQQTAALLFGHGHEGEVRMARAGG